MRSHIGNSSVLESLVTRIGRATPDCSRQWGTMNVHQMLEHIGDAAAAALGQRAFSATPRPGPRGLLRFTALYLLPRTPRGIKSGAEPAMKVVDAAAFVPNQERVISLLRQMAAPGQSFTATHPAFGPMTRTHWMRYAYLHTDHHLRQFGL
jgi:DinB family protein